MQVKEVMVKFTEGGKEYTFDCSNVFVRIGNKVVVETSRGMEIGTVCSKVSIKEVDKKDNELKPIIRLATDDDILAKEGNAKKELEIKQRCQTVANELKLEMKVIKASLTLDGSKVVITFTADDRVDFRELVKMLASEFKIKIELRQIDSKECTKIIGGLGPCGMECCCARFLSDAEYSSIKMAKVQGLSLNPTSISGLCGKLKCCLAYENEYYSETFALMPKVNSEVITPNGKGLVVYNNLLKRIVTVKFVNADGSSSLMEFELNQIKSVDGK